MPEKESKTFIVSFYPDKDAQGGALRQTLIAKVPHHLHGRLLNMAQKKGKELKAKSFAIFVQACPRIFVIDYPETEE